MKQQFLSAAILAACAHAGVHAAPAPQSSTPVSAAAVPASRPAASGQVTIRRDEYGMPHVYAATVHGIFYGYGYAVAQDRLFQMEMARRATQGKTAEVLGPSMVAFDKSIRGNFSPERIQRQLPRCRRKIARSWTATPPA